MALGAEHVEAAELDDAFAELDVDAAAGHVRRDRDRAPRAGASVLTGPVVPPRCAGRRKQFWSVIVASVTCSSWIATPSLASNAWWRPSLQRRPSMIRPVNSSTILTSPSWMT